MTRRPLAPDVAAALDAELRRALAGGGAYPHGTYARVVRSLRERFGPERAPSAGVVATRAARMRRDVAAYERRTRVRGLQDRARQTRREIDAATRHAADAAAAGATPTFAELKAMLDAKLKRVIARGAEGPQEARSPMQEHTE